MTDTPILLPHEKQLNRLILKGKYSFYSTLLFVLFANPETYRVLHHALGSYVHITEPSGIPTVFGFFFSVFLFFSTMISIMLFSSS